MTDLIHDLIFAAAGRTPDAEALSYDNQRMRYAMLAGAVAATANGLRASGLSRGERVAVYLEKRFETVIALFAATAAGGVMVPVNPVLKPEQVAYILIDCNVRILVTSVERLKLLQTVLPLCHDLHTVIVVDAKDDFPVVAGLTVFGWQAVSAVQKKHSALGVIDSDMAAIIYTSGSTGKPKGVVLSHRNLLAGAESVAQYLQNRPDDRILTVLPLSFDYGLNQLTSAFYAGAANVLMNYLLPHDIIRIVNEERITGLAAVPPLWIQLAQLDWGKAPSLRYITNSGGAMPRATLNKLRSVLPATEIFLMYGFTEAFRSTYLAPEEIDRRPDSIGKAVPNAEVLVLRDDGSPCAPGEPGELVHRGALVAMGYWNDAERTALCFKPLKTRQAGLPLAEIAAWSGDTVRVDEEGFLYFIERRDEMIKTSGYRVSPTEVEEVVYASEGVAEAVAIGVPHPALGQAIAVIVTARSGMQPDAGLLLRLCKQRLPAYMLPSHIELREGNLPRNPNGKIDRKLLSQELQHLFKETAQ
ncbi:acyl-CoA ligase (AMP-forming), exosortase A system-associated [Nitrosomonas sp. Is35]|uniref:acyl-CoA ligase (AMP-forming), exosortase A system-associated n=1 Tax=Nitrosomonas sp. Is35 TaxID=3080534 RepID=UPI00294B2866|nr:acyl-CoA ligase (AMP-forming), exosortase A system-associated [Nitrosomonas sp. Is35]MDV6346757.1 acyl-CoA ligase (AMP-forming), exosortase A system-associated [Nitrosomonas sp. Is35]